MENKRDFRFPIFINPSETRVLIIGLGNIGTRRLRTLNRFNFEIRAISKHFTDEARNILRDRNSLVIEDDYGKYEARLDFSAFNMIIAATDNRELNKRIGEKAKKAGVPVNVADCKEECSFFFPAIVETDDCIIGIAGDGNSHRKTAELSEKLREEYGVKNPEKI